jgi:hypothetical protein
MRYLSEGPIPRMARADLYFDVRHHQVGSIFLTSSIGTLQQPIKIQRSISTFSAASTKECVRFALGQGWLDSLDRPGCLKERSSTINYSYLVVATELGLRVVLPVTVPISPTIRYYSCDRAAVHGGNFERFVVSMAMRVSAAVAAAFIDNFCFNLNAFSIPSGVQDV